MNLVELLFVMAVPFAGAFIVAGIASAIAAVTGTYTQGLPGRAGTIGGGATFVALLVWRWWFRKMDRLWPTCRCGNSDLLDFEPASARKLANIWKCNSGNRYCYATSRLWFEVDEQDVARLFMKRSFLGHWREATEQEVLNQPVPERVLNRRASPP